MAPIALCEPTELYNILNQNDLKGRPCLSDRTYLLVLDVREYKAYEESHILTSRHSIPTDGGDFTLPADAEVETKHHCVVYDSCTEDLTNKESPVYCCAKMLAELTCKGPIMILKGGYEKFSALYPFLKSQQIIFSPREKESLTMYPIEVVPGTVYLGNAAQAADPLLLKHLGINNAINACPDIAVEIPDFIKVKNVSLEEGGDLLAVFKDISQMIENCRGKKDPVIIFSSDSLSRNVVLVLAYLMKRSKWTLEKAWKTLSAQKNYIRPNRSFVTLLSSFEVELCGEKTTNIDLPNY